MRPYLIVFGLATEGHGAFRREAHEELDRCRRDGVQFDDLRKPPATYQAKKGPRCPVTYGVCTFCGRTYARRATSTPLAIPRCTREECERAKVNQRMRAYAASKRAEGVDIFARYRDPGLEMQRRQERGHWRTRHQEKAALYDQRRDAKKRGATVSEAVLRRQVFERDGWTCGICGDPVDRELVYPDPMSVSLDHVLPLSLGGAHTHENTRCSHLRCNVARGNRLRDSHGAARPRTLDD